MQRVAFFRPCLQSAEKRHGFFFSFFSFSFSSERDLDRRLSREQSATSGSINGRRDLKDGAACRERAHWIRTLRLGFYKQWTPFRDCVHKLVLRQNAGSNGHLSRPPQPPLSNTAERETDMIGYRISTFGECSIFLLFHPFSEQNCSG